MSSTIENKHHENTRDDGEIMSPLPLERAILTNSVDSKERVISRGVSVQSLKYTTERNNLHLLTGEIFNPPPKPKFEKPSEGTLDFNKSFKKPVKNPAKPRAIVGDRETASEENSEIRDYATTSHTNTSTKPLEHIPKLHVLTFKKENVIQQMIENAEPDSVVYLPDGTIRIANLVLTKPMTIKGLPGTFLEITDGPIMINFQNEILKPNSKVIFSEITIYADFQKNKILDHLFGKLDSSRRTKETDDSMKDKKAGSSINRFEDRGEHSSHIPVDGTIGLFEVHSGSNLELRDCNIRSFVKPNFYTPEEKKTIDFQDVCVQLKHTDNSRESPGITMKSTTICGFHSFVYSENKGYISVVKSFLAEAEGHGISITNPDYIKINENIFDRPEKSAINIRFTKNQTYKSTIPICLFSNEIYRGNSHGITIFGETSKNPPLTLTIEKNKIFFTKKDGLAIKFVDYKELNLIYNQIESSHGNGIYIHNVISQDSSSHIICSKNYIRGCESNGLVIKNSTILLEESEIFGHKKNGVFIVFEEITADINFLSERKIIINHCKIYENSESGLNISGNHWGPFMINSCFIKSNLHGIFINEKHQENAEKLKRLKESKKAKKSIGTENNVLYYSIEKCEILSNGLSGIHVQNTNNHIYIAENTINMNKDYALYIERRDNKEYIHIKDISRGNFFDRLNGFIGGPWGEFVEEKPTTCKSTNCSIF